MHDAGAALRGVAADMRAGEPQVLAQELHQQGARIDIAGDGFAVHRHGNGRHDIPPNSGPKSPLFAPLGPGGDSGSKSRRFGPDALWNRIKSEPRPGRVKGSEGESVTGGAGRLTALQPAGEILEKIVGDLLGGAVDQALAELGELAADLRLDIVGQQRAAVLFGSATVAPPLAKPATPPSPSPEIL